MEALILSGKTGSKGPIKGHYVIYCVYLWYDKLIKVLTKLTRLDMSHDANVSVVLGMVSGLTANILTASIGTALLVAFLTGAAGYYGQQFAKFAHGKFKQIKDGIKKRKR